MKNILIVFEISDFLNLFSLAFKEEYKTGNFNPDRYKWIPLFLGGLLFLCFAWTAVFFSEKAFATSGRKTGVTANIKKAPALTADTQPRANQTPSSRTKVPSDNFSAYSFRPLLIQGKKRLIQKTKDMKVEGGNIAESQLFFIDVDFKERIFENEAIP